MCKYVSILVRKEVSSLSALQDGGDEGPEACAGCMAGLTMCGGGRRCILDQQVCDGRRDCPGGDDEVGLVTSGGVSLQCRVPGSPCLLHQSRDPGSPATPGRLCGPECLELRLWCDGHCHCQHCQDEQDCHHWTCQDGHFKCSVSGICIKDHKVW